MNGLADLNIALILNLLLRRKGLIIAVFLVSSLLAVYLAATLPNIYKSNTMILITPQRVPSSYVTSTVTTDLLERVQAIVQDILGRTQLQKIVQEFHLYTNKTEGAIQENDLEKRVERLRKSINVDFRKNNVFQLSYESEDPEKAKQVVGRLASLLIEQNLQVREQQAIGTKSFISAEAERLRKELEQQEVVVNRYKAANRFELPDQLDTNLRSLEQLRRELGTSSERLAALQERKGILQKQAVEPEIIGVDVGSAFSKPLGGDSIPDSVQLQLKKNELETLLQRYSSKHPDVTRLKREIVTLEGEIASSTVASKSEDGHRKPVVSPLKQVLRNQITDIDAEIQAIRVQHEGIRNQIGVLQARVDNASMRGIELSKITRGYDITLKKYQDLLAKSLESELSENMEKNQKGEQFQIVDEANFPLKPVRPNRRMIVLIGLLAGLAGGMGLAFVFENFDTSFKHSDELGSFVNLPLLATIPASITRGTVLDRRRSEAILVFASIGVLAIGVVCVRIFGPVYF